MSKQEKQETTQETSDAQNSGDKPEEQTRQEKENLPIGKLLRQAREKKALTVHDISRETNISSSNLTSIELGNYNDLPADTFVRGQVIIYANFLGLDGAEAARLFFAERAQRLSGKERKQFEGHGRGLSAKRLAEPAHISSATWAVILLALIMGVLIAFSWYTGWNPFAYFFHREPVGISTSTAVAVPAPPESVSATEAIQPDEKVSTETVLPKEREEETEKEDKQEDKESGNSGTPEQSSPSPSVE